MYLLGKAFNTLNHITAGDSVLRNERLDLYAKTLEEMATGCLLELALNRETRFELHRIANIISLETSTLIKNSVLLGFLTNRLPDPKIRSLGEELGDKVGYTFQVMNDLEPFASPQNVEFDKEYLNSDFNRSRKNIVMSYLFGACSIKEKEKLLQIGTNNDSSRYIFEIYQKYKVFNLVKSDLQVIKKQTENLLDTLALYDINSSCLEEFRKFYREIIAVGEARLEPKEH